MFHSSAKKKEKAAILARLASQEVASLMNRSIELSADRDRALAVGRIAKMFDVKLGDVRARNAIRQHVEQMICVLREADININFPAHKFFAGKPDPKYMTKYEKMRAAGAPMGDTRNAAEQKMFRFATHAGIDLATAGAGERAAALRITEYGDLGSASFKGAIRPKYCSVNFPKLIDGFGAQWGRSHLILKDHVKPNMTFTHSDSFDVVSSNRVTPEIAQNSMATYHHLNRLIVNMPESVLAALSDTVTGHLSRGRTFKEVSQQYGFGSTAYIEGQLHGEIHFNRDVKKIRVCYAEVFGSDNAATLREAVAKFGEKFKVPLEYFE